MSGFGAFGSIQPQQPQQTGSLFGAPATSTSLFGNTQPQQPQQPQGTTGGLFGTTNTNAQQGGTSGGLFGSTQPSTGGLFGNSSTIQQGGGGLFGNAGQQSTTAPSGGLFGATGANQTGNTGAGLFGSTANNQQGGGTTGGLFGSTTGTSTGTTSGLFGTANQNAAAPSGGLFGNTANTSSATGGGLFGNTAQNNTGSAVGLFGPTNTTPAASGGLFGTTQPTASNTQSSFFGNTSQAPANSMFGNLGQQQRQGAGSLFGGSTLGTSTLGGSTLLGSTNNNLFGSKPAMAPSPQQDAQSQQLQLMQKMQDIAQSWNPNSPQCRFQHYFYNLVDPQQVHLYGRPPNAFNDSLWQKAVRDNPDPSCFVPVVAVGFDDLQKRVEAQTQQANAHQEKIKDLQARITALAQRHQLSNASRLQRAAALQTQLTHRVLKLVQHLHFLIPALRSSALRPEEEALRTALEEIDEEVRRPGGAGRIRGKLNELWALVGAVTAARERDRRSGGVEWAVVDEDGLAQIAQILSEEQAGLAHLTKLLQKDMKDLAVIQGSPQEEDPDTLMASTATLRASTL